jgi:hypothetical protein
MLVEPPRCANRSVAMLKVKILLTRAGYANLHEGEGRDAHIGVAKKRWRSSMRRIVNSVVRFR